MKFEHPLGFHFEPSAYFMEKFAPHLPEDATVWWAEPDGHFYKVGTDVGVYQFTSDGTLIGVARCE